MDEEGRTHGTTPGAPIPDGPVEIDYDALRRLLNIVGGQWFDPPLPAHRTRSPALPIALAIMRAQFRLGIGSAKGYEALSARAKELGFPHAPFDPEQEQRPRTGGKKDGRSRRRRRRRVTATQI